MSEIASSSNASPKAYRVAGPHVMPNAAHAFGGIWRLSIRRFFSPVRWLVFAGMLFLFVLFSFPAARNAEVAARDFLPWAAQFYVCFLVPVLAFLSAAGTVRDDLQAGSVDYLFTRPVRRPTFLVLRYVAHVICAQFDFLLSFGTIVAIGAYWNVPGLGAAIPVLLLGQILTVVAFSAFGFLCAMLTSRYVIVGLLYGGLIEVGLGNVPTQLSRFSMVRQSLSVMSPIFDGRSSGFPLPGESLSIPAASLLLLGIATAMLGVAALIFSRREPAAALARET